jgi:hypothetical protein
VVVYDYSTGYASAGDYRLYFDRGPGWRLRRRDGDTFITGGQYAPWQPGRMESERALLISGMVLLSVSALLGFVQHRHRERPELFARWRVVHVGGTAGAVQLLVLAAVWNRFGAAGDWGPFLIAGLTVATWAFFLGPLAAALDHPRTAWVINRVGAAVALPAYLGLPFALLM